MDAEQDHQEEYCQSERFRFEIAVLPTDGRVAVWLLSSTAPVTSAAVNCGGFLKIFHHTILICDVKSEIDHRCDLCYNLNLNGRFSCGLLKAYGMSIFGMVLFAEPHRT